LVYLRRGEKGENNLLCHVAPDLVGWWTEKTSKSYDIQSIEKKQELSYAI
jgi:hypothetical protein